MIRQPPRSPLFPYPTLFRSTSLPLSSRNFTAVLGMSTGVAVEVSNATSFGRGSQNMSVNGANPEKNNFQMDGVRSEEHTSELQSQSNLVCRLLLEKKKNK